MSEHDGLIQPQPSAAPEEGRREAPRGVPRWVGYAVGVLLVIALATAGFWLAAKGQRTTTAATGEVAEAKAVSTWERPVVSDAGLIDRSGVRIVYVAVTGDGGLIDLRFQVVDPDKAGIIHDAAAPPAIVQDETGVVVKDLFMGHSHSDSFHAGQTYYLVFENPGNLVQRGNKVSVLLGDAEVDNIEVK